MMLCLGSIGMDHVWYDILESTKLPTIVLISWLVHKLQMDK